MKCKSIIMDEKAIERALQRMAYQIAEFNKGLDHVMLVGIQRRGVPMANRLAAYLKTIERVDVPVGVLDITLYRDDLTTIADQPVHRKSDFPFPVDNAIVVLVDDVLYTGRTVRAAIAGILDCGRPKRIELSVLIDRGHHEMPVTADFVGSRVPTATDEIIKVCFREIDDEESVKIMKHE